MNKILSVLIVIVGIYITASLAYSEAYPEKIESLEIPIEIEEVSEVVIEEEIEEQPATQLPEVVVRSCQPLGEDLPLNIDMDRVRAEWIEWNNMERRSLGLHEYVYNDQLNRTAILWSKISRDRGYMDHKRGGTIEYYDYGAMKEWFSDFGLEFQSGLFTENIAWEKYYCDAEVQDCTQEMIDSAKRGFNFFIGEKGTDYTAHYDSIVNPYFDIIGFGVAVDDEKNNYYLTVHYAKAISNEPLKICD